ncbi:protein SLC31A2-like [Littorina saxatilis]|uniref:Copper transport protein n=1 Tax=Littorina saxatilis TaxID=31220 RepID=A0AAN9B8A4_9CAEN
MSQPHRTAFHLDYGDTVLFPSWVLYSKKEAFLSSLALVVMGVLYQGLKYIRLREGRRCPNMQCKRYILNKGHIIQTVLYIIQFIGGYFLMLAVMTYNVWLVVGGVVGLGLGYFFFGWIEEESFVTPTVQPTSRCGLAVDLDCGFQGKMQELQPLSTADGGGVAGDGSIACQCDESAT